MKLLAFAAILCFFMVACQAAVEPPPLRFEADPFFETNFQVFPVSSEVEIGKIQHLVLPAERGAYVTVGSERSFRGASMMPNITYLIQLDISPDIIRYNLINKELLKAPNLETYKKLRWTASFLDWKRFIAQAKEQKHPVHLTQDDYTWWQRNVRDINEMLYPIPEELNRFQSSPPCPNDNLSSLEKRVDLGQILDYKTGNYLFFEALYQRLHQLAITNRIFTIQINLMDKDQTHQFIKYLKQNKIHISILDLDNLYLETYLGQNRYQELLEELLPLGNAQSILITMSNYKEFACAQYQLYLGFTFEHIRQWPETFKIQSFMDQLPDDIYDLIDGRLYEGHESLPQFGDART